MSGWRMETGGAQRVRGKLEKALNFLGGTKTRAIMRESGDEAIEIFKKQIESFKPGRVKDLSEGYKAQKLRSAGFVYPILVRTGEMVDSMFTRVSKDDRGWLIQLRFKGARNQRIAERHIKGDGKLPRRDFTLLPPDFHYRVLKRLREALWGR